MESDAAGALQLARTSFSATRASRAYTSSVDASACNQTQQANQAPAARQSTETHWASRSSEPAPTHMEGEVDHAAEDVGRHAGGRHGAATGRGRGGVAEVLEVALREVHHDAALPRQRRDGAGARVP